MASVEKAFLPDIKGPYRNDLMKLAERDVLEPNVDGVLLTHAHSDHADYISFVHEKIPIYIGATCHLILKAIEERANRQIEIEILTYNKKDLTIKKMVPYDVR